MAGSVNTAGRCLIVSANQVVSPYPVYPLGAACLVSALEDAGYAVHHHDILSGGGVEALGTLLADRQFDLLALSIRNIDTVDGDKPLWFLPQHRQVVEVLRAGSRAPLVLGGPGFSIMPERIMTELGAEYGIVGEGETLLPWLLAELVAARPPRKRLFYANGKRDSWQTATISESSANYYLRHGGMLNLQSKRGCPYQCSYCTYPAIEGRQLRYRDPRQVVAEMQRLHREVGARYIFFADSVFNDPAGKYLELAAEMVRQQVEIPWSAFFRPQGLRESDLQLLKRAGLAAMELGTDAACDRTLAGINKNFGFADVLEVHEQIVKAEIPSAHFIIFGGPGENRETLAEGLANISKLAGAVVFAFVGIRILPGTSLHRQALKEGVIEPEQDLLAPVFYYSPEVTREEIREAIEKSFAGQIDRVYPSDQFEQRIQLMHQMGQVGPLWDLLLRGPQQNGRRRRS